MTKIKDLKCELKALDMPLKNRIIFRLISILMTLFFISAPLLLLINLLIFYDYIYLDSLGIVVIFILGVVLQDYLYYKMVEYKYKSKLNCKSIYVRDLIYSGIFAIIVYGIIMWFVYMEV